MCRIGFGVAQMLVLQLQKMEKFVIVRHPKDTLMVSSTMRLVTSRQMNSNVFMSRNTRHGLSLGLCNLVNQVIDPVNCLCDRGLDRKIVLCGLVPRLPRIAS